ncbi:MAG: putative salt-induced outer membrane protein YdiY [Candidatus Paceibacteria bacterium]|jgi:putative salt-induced outer membrane protein YdiY
MKISCVLMVLMANSSWAFPQDGTGPGQALSPPGESQSKARRPFIPPIPVPDTFDWIKLTSGEWLKGEIIFLRDGTLEFDSDELNVLRLDIDDVKELRSPHVHSLQVDGRPDLFGTVVIQDELVTVSGERGGIVPRRLLMSIVPGLGSWRDHWDGKASLGLSARSGNTSQFDGTAYLFLRRQTTATRWESTFNGAVSTLDGVETANNSRLNSSFDVFLSRRLFITPLAATAFLDRFSNIDLRFTPSAGVGYDLFQRNSFSWEVKLGPAYELTKYDSVDLGQSLVNETFAMQGNTGMEWDITPDVEFAFDYALTVPFPETNSNTHHMSAMLSIDLVDDIELDLTAIWDRVNNPLTDADNNTPEPDDFRLTVGIGVGF